jgi:hypothetical protein
MLEGTRNIYSTEDLPSVRDYICRLTDNSMTGERITDVLTNVIAGPSYVFDWHEGGTRALVGVLIDTCAAEGNAAELSLFFEEKKDPDWKPVMKWALELVKKSERTHLDIPEWKGTRLPRERLDEYDFHVGYHMFNMNAELANIEKPALPSDWHWASYQPAHGRALY